MPAQVYSLVSDQIKQLSVKSLVTKTNICTTLAKFIIQFKVQLDCSPFFSPYFLYSPAHTPLKPSPSWVTNIMSFLLRAMSDMKTWRPYAHRHCLTELPQERQQNTWQIEGNRREKMYGKLQQHKC